MARFKQSDYQERTTIVFDHPGSLTADTTYKFWQAPRACYVADVRYINPTGLVEHATNAFAGSVLNGATVVATLFDTDSDEAGTNTLAADTFVTGAIVAAAKNLASGDVLSLFLDEDAAGAATMPAGRLIVEIVYL